MPQKSRTGTTKRSTKTRRTATKRTATKRTSKTTARKQSSATKRTSKTTARKQNSATKRASKTTARKQSSAKKRASKTTARKQSSATKRAVAPSGNGTRKTAAKQTRPYEVRRSPIQGRGAFATRDIRRGERIGEYRGERISWEEADSRYDDEAQERHHTFLFEVDDETVIDAGVRGSGVKYINHSCDPNCEAVIKDGRVFIDAIRPIRSGKELFYDYSYVLDERHTPAVKKRYPCWCGSKNCRGTILASKR